MNKPSLTFQRLPGIYAICRLASKTPQPPWADGEGFVSLTRGANEYSIVCLQARVPAGVQSSGDWYCLELLGPFAFDEAGIVAAMVNPLADAGIGVFVISSFDADHLLVRIADWPVAHACLQRAGHRVLVSASVGDP